MEYTFQNSKSPLYSITTFLQDKPREKKWTVIRDANNTYLIEGIQVDLKKNETMMVSGSTTTVINKFKY